MSNPSQFALEPGSKDDEVDSTDISINDVENPRSLINLVPDKVRDAILNVLANHPDYVGLSEYDLRDKLRPDDTVSRIRIAFWHEYYRAQDQHKSMMMSRVYSGVTSYDTFYGRILSNPKNVAWLLMPPVKWTLAMEEALNRGMRNLTKLMEIRLVDELGNMIPKAAAVFLKAFELLNERVNGAVTQKIEQKNLTITRKLGDEGPPDMESLRAELDLLREKAKLPEIEAKKVISEENS